MKHKLSLLSAFLVLFVTAVDVAGDTDTPVKLGNPAPASSEVQTNQTDKPLKIAIIELVPLSPGAKIKKNPLVFTGEYYSSTKSSEGKNAFIPNEYLDIVHTTLIRVLRMHDYTTRLISIAKIDELFEFEPDLILLGAVKTFACAKTAKKASRCFTKLQFGFLDAKSLELYAEREIEVSKSFPEIPFNVNKPVHMVGHHGQDFHPQRMLLAHSMYNASLNLIEIIKEEMDKVK